MKKSGPLMRWLLTAAILLLAGWLCWQCIDIWRTGNAPENLDENGLHIVPVYTAGEVAERLMPVGAGAAVLAVLAVAAAVAGHGEKARAKKTGGHGRHKPAVQPESVVVGTPVQAARIVLLAAAVVFIVLGVMNGGLRDVLVKAINICTECIGLG